MPEGPLGGGRPFADCNVSFIVYGNPRNPPTADEVKEAIKEAGHFKFVNNIVEQNINTDKIEGMASNGTQQVVILEMPSDTAISVNQDWERVKRFNDAIRSINGAAVFIVAR